MGISPERAARDQSDQVYYVPENMTYREWEKKCAANNSNKEKTLVKDNENTTTNTISEKPDNNSDVKFVGYIDLGIFHCITEDITTNEVVITNERIGHIEDHHPGAYEKVKDFFSDMLKKFSAE